MQQEIKVMIVEDQEPVREGLRILIDGSEGYRCIMSCRTAEEALISLGAETPDVVLMDINLPGMSGIECVVHIKNRFPLIQVMMLTVFDNNEQIFKSLEAGATGYMLKKTPPARLLEAITELVNGGSPMNGEIARKVVMAFMKPLPAGIADFSLTSREEEILACLSKGYLYKEIADKLFISLDTVRSHIRNIYQKLHVRTRTEALLLYMNR
ncbi:MAG TPA: response regulator transcription factor [Bacteroidales bacterium]|nr:response regulator transcription factor [Bacteroidales bacterium]HRZ49264.1 response regulator transcription factor [Bacteroidales bacterium]